jgi:FkbM family methyltransferase
MPPLLARTAKFARLVTTPKFWKPAFNTRTAAAVEHLEALELIQPQTVIDVGANKGQFSLAARHIAPSAHIIAFEPLEAAADIFELNFFKDPLTRLIRLALASKEGLLPFHVANRGDSSSLLAPGLGSAAAYDVQADAIVDIPVKRLDQVLDVADLKGSTLLKIDVQGTEPDVVLGAGALLHRIDFIYLEASFVELYEQQMLAGDLVDTLSRLGFAWRGVFNRSFTHAFGPTQADLLFERRA